MYPSVGHIEGIASKYRCRARSAAYRALAAACAFARKSRDSESAPSSRTLSTASSVDSAANVTDPTPPPPRNHDRTRVQNEIGGDTPRWPLLATGTGASAALCARVAACPEPLGAATLPLLA